MAIFASKDKVVWCKLEKGIEKFLNVYTITPRGGLECLSFQPRSANIVQIDGVITNSPWILPGEGEVPCPRPWGHLLAYMCPWGRPHGTSGPRHHMLSVAKASINRGFPKRSASCVKVSHSVPRCTFMWFAILW